MKITKIATSVFTTFAVMSVAMSANASEYIFNNFVGKVYVGEANVDFYDEGVNLALNIHTPVCPNQYHIEGSVTLKYTSPGEGGWASRTWNFSGSDQEDVDLSFSDYLPYYQAEGGVVNVSTSANCVWHGTKPNSGILWPF